MSMTTLTTEQPERERVSARVVVEKYRPREPARTRQPLVLALIIFTPPGRKEGVETVRVTGSVTRRKYLRYTVTTAIRMVDSAVTLPDKLDQVATWAAAVKLAHDIADMAKARIADMDRLELKNGRPWKPTETTE